MGRDAEPMQTRGVKSHRRFKVGEEIRHILSQLLLRADFHEPNLEGISVTLSEVSISPDFGHARVYFVPLGEVDIEQVQEGLARIAPVLQQQLSRRLTTKRSPRLRFLPDTGFETAGRVARLIEENRRSSINHDANEEGES